jgi:hypothetical protein
MRRDIRALSRHNSNRRLYRLDLIKPINKHICLTDSSLRNTHLRTTHRSMTNNSNSPHQITVSLYLSNKQLHNLLRISDSLGNLFSLYSSNTLSLQYRRRTFSNKLLNLSSTPRVTNSNRCCSKPRVLHNNKINGRRQRQRQRRATMLSNIMTTANQLWAINHSSSSSSSNGLLYSNLNLQQDDHTTPGQGRRYRNRSLSMEQI